MNAKLDEVEQILMLVRSLPLFQKVNLLEKMAVLIQQEFSNSQLAGKPRGQLKQLETDALTYLIIGRAMAAHRARGPGHRENIYQRDLESFLVEAGVQFTPQKMLEVFDSSQQRKLIGYYIPDFIVDNRVIVEIKALHSLDNRHVAQVIAYLAASGCKTGLLINFGTRSLEYQRVLPPKNVSEHQVNRQWLFVPEWLRGD